MLIDTHAHIYDVKFDADRDRVIADAVQAGVGYMVMPNEDVSSLARMEAVHRKYPECTGMAIGLHPTCADGHYAEALSLLRQAIDRAPHLIAAIGEIGLDYYWDASHASDQLKALSVQLDWAVELDLPVILHARSAYQELIDLLTAAPYREQIRGVFHCFDSDASHLHKILSELPGMMIGINGHVTYKKSRLPELLRSIPSDRMLLETDAPYLAPVPKRGRRNEPAYLTHTAAFVAEVLGLPLSDLISQTSKNACVLFGLPPYLSAETEPILSRSDKLVGQK